MHNLVPAVQWNLLFVSTLSPLDRGPDLRFSHSRAFLVLMRAPVYRVLSDPIKHAAAQLLFLAKRDVFWLPATYTQAHVQCELFGAHCAATLSVLIVPRPLFGLSTFN